MFSATLTFTTTSREWRGIKLVIFRICLSWEWEQQEAGGASAGQRGQCGVRRTEPGELLQEQDVWLPPASRHSQVIQSQMVQSGRSHLMLEVCLMTSIRRSLWLGQPPSVPEYPSRSTGTEGLGVSPLASPAAWWGSPWWPGSGWPGRSRRADSDSVLCNLYVISNIYKYIDWSNLSRYRPVMYVLISQSARILVCNDWYNWPKWWENRVY